MKNRNRKHFLAFVLAVVLLFSVGAAGHADEKRPDKNKLPHMAELVVDENGVVADVIINGEKNERILRDTQLEGLLLEDALSALIDILLTGGDPNALSEAALVRAQDGDAESNGLLQLQYDLLAAQALSQRYGVEVPRKDAVAIALDHAAAVPEDIYLDKARLDREDGVLVWEVEFDLGGYEYEYEIDSVTGTVLKFDKDRD